MSPDSNKTKAKHANTNDHSKKNIKVVFKFRGGEVNTDNLPKDVLDVRSEERSVMFEGKTFWFSEVLGPNSNQLETYKKSCKEIIGKVLEGYNGTIFVYGNSGSGKTFTMLGPDSVIEYLSSKDMFKQTIDSATADKFGIILRASNEIFELMNKGFEDKTLVGFKTNVQYFEIYWEKIYDLIEYTGESSNIKMTKTGETYADPMTKREVTWPKDIWDILKIGQEHK